MHIGAVALFEAAPLRTPDGGIDADRIRTLMEAQLHRIPRYRQRLLRVPLFGQPVWVDDTRFNLGYHLRPSLKLPTRVPSALVTSTRPTFVRCSLK